MSSRLVDDEILEDGSRLLLIEDEWPCPTGENAKPLSWVKGTAERERARYIHPCTLDNNPEGLPKCSVCGDFIPTPVGLRLP